jgi:ubiquinol-cytochrome c reductase cytochrome b subunit
MSETNKPGLLVGALIGLRDWTDARLPIMSAWKKHMSEYYAPSKTSIFWYFFGVLSMVVLVIQLLSGIWLTMNYTASAEAAFASVEYIMRDVDYGWMLALYTLHRRFGVLCCGLYAYVPRHDVRLISEAA